MMKQFSFYSHGIIFERLKPGYTGEMTEKEQKGKGIVLFLVSMAWSEKTFTVFSVGTWKKNVQRCLPDTYIL